MMKFLPLDEVRFTKNADGHPSHRKEKIWLNKDMIKLMAVERPSHLYDFLTKLYLVGQVDPYVVEQTPDQIEAMANSPLHVKVHRP